MKPIERVGIADLKAGFLMRVQRHGDPHITIDGTAALFVGRLGSSVFTTPIELRKV